MDRLSANHNAKLWASKTRTPLSSLHIKYFIDRRNSGTRVPQLCETC